MTTSTLPTPTERLLPLELLQGRSVGTAPSLDSGAGRNLAVAGTGKGNCPLVGLRLRTTARLAGARIAIVIDIGFGDAVEPGVGEINLPVLLDLPAPRLRAYARETVITEKFQAMFALGLANRRMKDYYDIWLLSRNYVFDGERLRGALAATFERRGTAVPEEAPDALTQAFATDATKQRQWVAFIRDLAADAPSLETIVNDLARFLMPYVQQATQRKGAADHGIPQFRFVGPLL